MATSSTKSRKKCAIIFALLFVGICIIVGVFSFRVHHISWNEEIINREDASISCYSTMRDEITYYFPQEEFDQKVAARYVLSVSELLKYSDTFFSMPVSQQQIYIGFADSKIQMNENGPTYNDLWEIVKDTHLSCIDAAETFGLFAAYAKRHHLTNDSFLSITDSDISEIRNILNNEDSLYLLDFTLPMIDDIYFDRDQSLLNRRVIIAFSNWFIETYSFHDYEKLCRNLSDDASQLISVKNDWLQSLGCSPQYAEYGKIFFQYANTELSTYKIEAEDAIWFWADTDVQKLGYQEMVRNHVILEPLRIQDFADARAFLKDYLPDNLEKVKIQTQFNTEIRSYYSYLKDQTIVLADGWCEAGRSLLHEYCHFLTIGEGRILSYKGVFEEWYAVVMSSIQLENRMKETFLLMYFGEDYLKETGYWDYETNRFSSKLGTYRFTLENRNYEDENVTLWNEQLNYGEWGVLAEYIIEKESFDYFVRMSQEQYHYESFLGMTLNELYAEMIPWLEAQVPSDSQR